MQNTTSVGASGGSVPARILNELSETRGQAGGEPNSPGGTTKCVPPSTLRADGSNGVRLSLSEHTDNQLAIPVRREPDQSRRGENFTAGLCKKVKLGQIIRTWVIVLVLSALCSTCTAAPISHQGELIAAAGESSNLISILGSFMVVVIMIYVALFLNYLSYRLNKIVLTVSLWAVALSGAFLIICFLVETWMRLVDSFLCTIEPNPGPSDGSSSLTCEICKTACTIHKVCNKCGACVPSKQIIAHLRSTHPIKKPARGAGKAESVAASLIAEKNQADGAVDTAKEIRDEAREINAEAKRIAKGPNSELKDELEKIELQSKIIRARDDADTLLESLGDHPRPGEEWSPPSIYTGFHRTKLCGRIVVGELYHTAGLKVFVGRFRSLVLLALILFALITTQAVAYLAIPLSRMVVTKFNCGFATTALEVEICTIMNWDHFYDWSWGYNSPGDLFAHVTAHLLGLVWVAFFLAYLCSRRTGAVRSRLLACRTSDFTQHYQDDRPIFDHSEKRSRDFQWAEYRLVVEHKLPKYYWCFLKNSSRYYYETKNVDIPDQWKRTGKNKKGKLKKHLLLSPQMMQIMVNRRTLTAKRDQPQEALDCALRMMSACSAYQEDYTQLTENGRSVYRDAALVYGAIVSKSVYHDNLHF